MPFESKAQRAFLEIHHPDIAAEFAKHTSTKTEKRLPEHARKKERRYDAVGRLAKAQRTQQGYVRVDARLTRTGVFPYRRADGSVVRELRHPADVFSAASLATAEAGLPVTVGHPADPVDAANSRALKVGQTRADARPDGRFLAAQLQIEDPATISRVDSGELSDLSMGYTVDIVPESGTYNGEPYDQRQANIEYNHVALLPPKGGRAGSEVALRLDSGDAVLACGTEASYDSDMVKLRLDGTEYEVEAPVAKALEDLQRDNGRLAAELANANKRADEALAPAQLDAAVAARVALVDNARRVLGADWKADGLTASQVHRAVLEKAGVKCEGRADSWLEGAFEATVAAPRKVQSTAAVAAFVPPTASTPDRKDAAAEVLDIEKIRAESIAAKGNLWKREAK